MFEQTAPFPYAGKGYDRRTCEQYTNILTENGFGINKICVIDYWLHRLILEKHLIKWICKRNSNMESDDIRINMNKKWWYKRLSELLTALSIPHIFNGLKRKGIVNRWGYCLIEAIRKV